MSKKIYKLNGAIWIEEPGKDRLYLNTDDTKLVISDDVFMINDSQTNRYIELGKYDDIIDENNNAFISFNTCLTYLRSTIEPSTVIQQGGENISVQNPLNTDNSSIYTQDIDFANSDFTDWVGDPTKLFNSPYSSSIVNSTSSNPKQIVLAFNRTVNALQIGFGENNGGDFSNLKISLIGSGGHTRAIYDLSTINDKETSKNAKFTNELFNSILIEFYTADTVSLSNITIQKSNYDTVQIEAKKPDGEITIVNSNVFGNLLVSLDEQKDAFGRLKIAEPYTIFDSSMTSSISSNIFWSELKNGTATSIYNQLTSKVTMSTASDGDYIVRQTKQRFKYQPGKSHEFFITGRWQTEAGQRKRAGLVDYDNIGLGTITNQPQNGVFFENNGGILSWNIVNNGSITETVTQENWNIDLADGTGSSGFVFDPDSVNILSCQLEWLGVGVVLVGFAIGEGTVIYVHRFKHASEGGINVYMRTANLPVSYEITSIAGAGEMTQICSSVISGGGFNPKGLTSAIRNTTAVGANSKSVVLCGIRLKEDSFEFTVDPTFISMLNVSNSNTLWTLSLNPVYASTVTWVDVSDNEIQRAVGTSANLVSDFGTIIAAGSFSNNSGGINLSLNTSLGIGKGLDGSRDELWLTITSLGNDSYYGTINFKTLI